MKIFYLLLLIGSTLISTYDDSWGYKLYDINYNTDYTVDIAQFPEGYIPGHFQFYFRLPIEEDGPMKIQLKVIKRVINQYLIRVCPYQTKPSDQNIFSGHNDCTLLEPFIDHSDGNTDVYLFNYEKVAGMNYLVILVRNYYALDYLNIYIHSAPEETPK